MTMKPCFVPHCVRILILPGYIITLAVTYETMKRNYAGARRHYERYLNCVLKNGQEPARNLEHLPGMMWRHVYPLGEYC